MIKKIMVWITTILAFCLVVGALGFALNTNSELQETKLELAEARAQAAEVKVEAVEARAQAAEDKLAMLEQFTAQLAASAGEAASWCQPAGCGGRLEEVEGGRVHLIAGDPVSVNVPPGECGQVFTADDQTVSITGSGGSFDAKEFTVGPCGGETPAPAPQPVPAAPVAAPVASTPTVIPAPVAQATPVAPNPVATPAPAAGPQSVAAVQAATTQNQHNESSAAMGGVSNQTVVNSSPAGKYVGAVTAEKCNLCKVEIHNNCESNAPNSGEACKQEDNSTNGDTAIGDNNCQGGSCNVEGDGSAAGPGASATNTGSFNQDSQVCVTCSNSVELEDSDGNTITQEMIKNIFEEAGMR